jgi:peptide/nickel transport system ATP-binding protein
LVSNRPLLRVKDLEISYYQKPIVQNISFELFAGEMVAITGPSGCGKSVTAHAMVGMLGDQWKVTKGQMVYNDQIINFLDEKEWQRFRRKEISLLIQESLNGLNPIRTVKKQMVETLRLRQKWKSKELEEYLHSLLYQVGFSHPNLILSSYPFELSGGMRQRILLAMMVSMQPKILIADEPTTALDAINREKVLTLLKRLQKDYQLTILLISHDQQSINKYANRIIQMNAGGVTS